MTKLPSDALQFGKEENLIRAIAGYAATRAEEIGPENVFNFSIGSPNVPAPPVVREALTDILATVPPAQLHAYSPAAGFDGEFTTTIFVLAVTAAASASGSIWKSASRQGTTTHFPPKHSA